jgi:hypothetical protein
VYSATSELATAVPVLKKSPITYCNKTYCNLSCLLLWQRRVLLDDLPTGAGRIDWALNLAGKRMAGLMRIPIVETTCPKDSLSGPDGWCQALTLARQLPLGGETPIWSPVRRSSYTIREAVT